MNSEINQGPCSLFQKNNEQINRVFHYQTSFKMKNQPDFVHVFLASNTYGESCYTKNDSGNKLTAFINTEFSLSNCCINSFNINPGLTGEVRQGIFHVNGIHFDDDQSFEIFFEGNSKNLPIKHKPFFIGNNLLFDLNAFLPSLIDTESSFPFQLITIQWLKDDAQQPKIDAHSLHATCVPDGTSSTDQEIIKKYKFILDNGEHLASIEIDAKNKCITYMNYCNPYSPERETMIAKLESIESMNHQEWLQKVFHTTTL